MKLLLKTLTISGPKTAHIEALAVALTLDELLEQVKLAYRLGLSVTNATLPQPGASGGSLRLAYGSQAGVWNENCAVEVFAALELLEANGYRWSWQQEEAK